MAGALLVLVAVSLTPRPTAPLQARAGPGWAVARLRGDPRLGSEAIGDGGTLRIGDWLETDARSAARVAVASIGEVEVGPRSRLRLVETRPSEHRLELARGSLSARVSAPPRMFLVETPSAVSVDLGCSYRLVVNDAGESLLRVMAGWVALAWNGRESLVPAGAACLARPGAGPGTPYFVDAPAALQEAVRAVDRGAIETGGIRRIASLARRRDALTLWHLLRALPAAYLTPLYSRLQQIVPAPPGVSRERVLAHDSAALDSWRWKIQEEIWLSGANEIIRQLLPVPAR